MNSDFYNLYQSIELESEQSDCFSTIVSKFPSNSDFQSFLGFSNVKLHALVKSRRFNCFLKIAVAHEGFSVHRGN